MYETLTVEVGRERGTGRWLANIHKLPGVMAYGADRQEAVRNAKAAALHVLADSLQHPTELDSFHVIASGAGWAFEVVSRESEPPLQQSGL